MRRSIFGILCGALAALVTGPAASASLLIYEPFNDTASQALLGQSNTGTGTNWLRAAGTATTTAINTTSGSLTMPAGLPAAMGNSVAITGIGNSNGGANRLAFDSSSTTITSGTVYFSMAMRVDSLTGSNNNIGAFIFGLNNTANSATTAGGPSIVGARLQVRIDPSDDTMYDIGIFNNHAATAGAASWSSGLTVGDTLFLAGSYTFNTGSSSDDVSSLWINPAPNTFGATSPPTPTLSDTTGGSDLADIGSIILRQSTAPYLTVDEIRVGTTWTDVTVPEPATIGILGIAAAVGVLARQRRRI